MELVIGPDVGISYLTEKASSVCLVNISIIYSLDKSFNNENV